MTYTYNWTTIIIHTHIYHLHNNIIAVLLYCRYGMRRNIRQCIRLRFYKICKIYIIASTGVVRDNIFMVVLFLNHE